MSIRLSIAAAIVLFIPLTACAVPTEVEPLPDSTDDTAESVTSELDTHETKRPVPSTCDLSGRCPLGTHCDFRVGMCVWECSSSKVCGPKSHCSAEGRCTDQLPDEIPFTLP